MKKLCPNCKYYGKCSIDNKSCKDFVQYDTFDRDVVVNIQSFNTKWMSKWKKWWMRFDATILQQRIKKVEIMLQGKSIDEWLKEQEGAMAKAVVKEVEGNEAKSIS